MSSANIFKGQRQVPIFTGELKLYWSTPTFLMGTPNYLRAYLRNVLGSRFNLPKCWSTLKVPKMFDELQLPLGPLLLTPVF